MENIIEAANLCKAYGNQPVLNGLSLAVSKGQVFGLLGVNGAGKSTAIGCMLGTVKADEGSVSILGMSPEKDRRRLFEDVGVQFQETGYPEKIRVDELCQETACLYRQPADYHELLHRFGLAEKEKSLVCDLSGGQKQKLFVILALLSRPKVLFLDELTTGLDTKARRNVWNSLRELKQAGITMVLSSHFMDEVEALCDRIGILKDGRFVFSGTVCQAITQSGCSTLEDAYLWYTGEEPEI